MRTIVRILLGLFVIVGLMRLAGLLAARLLPSHGDAESDTIGLVAIFDGIDLASHAQAFRGGSVTTAFGGVRLDLRDVTLADGDASLELKTFFGGVQILVPQGWRVDMADRSAAGGSDVSVEDTAEPTGHLSVSTRTVFGGVQVTDHAE